MTEVIWGTKKKPVSSDQLAKFFEDNSEHLSGELFIGYPIIATPEGAFPIDALWISREKGLVIFNLIEGKNIGDYADFQDESANRLETRLRGHKSLMKGRTLLASPNVVTFAPAAEVAGVADDEHPLCNLNNIGDVINEVEWAHPEVYEAAGWC